MGIDKEVNPGRYKFDIFLARKMANGELDPVPLVDSDKKRIERVYSPMNVDKLGLPGDIIIREPLISDGVSRISIKLTDLQRGPGESDIPIYRYLYGGKMSFQFKRFKDPGTKSVSADNQLFVVIESPKFGTSQAVAAFNPKTQRYEVEFSEDWWNGGWGSLNQKLSRAALLRVLGTADSIGISAVSTNNDLVNARIGGLSLEVARDFNGSPSEHLLSAPVEICECAASEGRSLSPSCEVSQSLKILVSLRKQGCTNLQESTVVNLDPSGPDFHCGGCKGPRCDQCSPGEFKYDFLTNTMHETCQKGVKVETDGRVVVATPGSRVELACRATSYRGGIPVHTWRLPAQLADSRDFAIRRELLPFKPRMKNGTWIPITSETRLSIDNAKEEYSGLYECQVAALGANLTEPFYLVIRDPAMDQPVEPGDILNEQFPVPLPAPSSLPFAVYVTATKDTTDPKTAVIEGKISPPGSLDDFHIIWLASNGTQIIPIDPPEINRGNGEFKIRLPIDLDEADKRSEKIHGFLVGKDPIKTPIWVPLPEPTRFKEPATLEDISRVHLNYASRNLSFLEPALISVVYPDGKPKNAKVTWRRVGPHPLESSEFPDGLGVDRNDNLVIYAAGEEHEGTYEATVTFPETGKVIKLQTQISVEPWSPPLKIEVPLGQAGENFEEAKDVEPPQPTDENAFIYYVSGFTPDSVHCENPKWILVDRIRNTTTDITEKVNRESATRFIINYPLASGKYIKFECLPVPSANLSGSLEFDIDSPDVRSMLIPIYDDPYSIFPTRLYCGEGNPDIDAEVSITSDSLSPKEIKAMEKPRVKDAEEVELDWRRVGGFQPVKHSVKYVCTVKTPMQTVQKSIEIKPRPLPEHLDLAARSTVPKLRVSSPGRVLVPTGESQYRLDVREGEAFEVIAQYNTQSDDGEITWSLDDSTEVPEITVDGGHSWKRIKFTDTPTLFDGKVLNVAINTPEGEKTAKVTLGVSPSDRPFAIVNLNSSSMINGDLIGLANGDMTIDVKTLSPDGRELPKDLETFWRISRANGEPITLEDGILAQRYSQSNPSRLELQGLPPNPTEFSISAAVVIPMGEKKELFTSVPYRLIIREGLIKAFIQGLTGPGVLSGHELGTVGASCVARDIWRNDTVEGVTYDWDYVILPDGVRGELPTANDKVKHDEATQAELPWSALTLQDNAIYMGNLRNRPGWTTSIRCRAKMEDCDKPVVSEWFRLNVIPGDIAAKFPKIEIRPTFESEIFRFPTKVECIDINTDVPSTVTWTKDGQAPPPSVKMETDMNKATLSWSVGDSNEFSPRDLAGTYTCEVKNEYRTVIEHLFLPADIMDKHDQEKVPITKEYIRIKSTHQPIEDIDGQKRVIVDEGEKFELVCEYYGNPAPDGGLSWRLTYDSESSTYDALAKVNGLVWERGRNYWALVQSNAFNQYAPQTGTYTCEAVDQSGNVLASNSITVDIPEKEYDVKVEGLNDFGVLRLQPGGSGSVKCRVTDPKTGETIPTYGRLKKIEWEGPMVESASVNSLSDLAEYVGTSGEDLSFQRVHADLPERMKAKCIFFDGKNRKDSEPFFIVVRGEGGTDGKNRVIVEEIPSTDPNERRFQCHVFDTFSGQRIENAIASWYFVTPEGGRILPGHLFKEVNKEGNMIILSSLRDDINFQALNGGVPIAEGRCFAHVPEAHKVYLSDAFMTIAAKQPGEKPEEVGDTKPKKDTPHLNIEGDKNGEVPFEEGSDVFLKCRLEEANPEWPKFGKRYTYLWQIARKDGRPVDTSVVARNIEVNTLPEGGLGLKLIGLKASAAGVEAKCYVLNETDETKPEFLDFPSGDNSVKFVDTKPASPGEKPSFAGVSDYDTVPENDKRNKYVVNLDGLDDQGRLSASLGSNWTLYTKILDKESGEETTPGGPIWKTAGIEVVHADGRPAPLSHLAKEIRVDSNLGEIKLLGFKGDSELPNGDDLFVRVIVEKTPEDDKKPRPGQIGDPNKERYASAFIPVAITDREGLDNRAKGEKSSPLTPIVHGLSKCHTLPLEAGKDATLSCKARDVSDDSGLVYSWAFHTPEGRSVSVGKIAKFIVSSGNLLTLTNMKAIAEGESLHGHCVIARKKDVSQKFYSRDFLVGPQCGPLENEVVRVEELLDRDPDQRRFRCVVTKRDDESVITDATYNWEFSTPSGEVILPGHLFEGVEMYSDSVVLGRLRSDIDIAKYFGDTGPSVIEGRCVAIIPLGGPGDEPKKVISDPMVRVSKDDATDGPKYSISKVVEDDKPGVDIIGIEDGKLITKPDETVTLKCLGVDYQTGSTLGNIEYAWEVQTNDGRPIDSSALAERIELAPTSDSLGYELKLIRIRQSANGLRLRCVLRGAGDKEKDPGAPGSPLKPDEGAPGDFIDVVVEKDPSRPWYDEIRLEEVNPTPDDDPRNPFHVKVDGLDSNGNLAGPENSTISIKSELIDEFTGRKADVPPGEEIIYGLEVTNADRSPAPLNRIADSVEIDGMTGEIKFVNFKGDSLDPVAKDVRIRVVAEINKPGERQRFASPYIYPVLIQDGKPVEEGRPIAKAWEELKPMVVGLSYCRNLPIEVGSQKTLICDVKGSDNEVNKLLYGWELRDESGNELPFSGSVTDFSKQSGNKLQLIGLFQPSKPVYGRCIVARPSAGSSKYYSDFFEIGAECKPSPQSSVRVDVQSIPRHDPNERAFECFAYDSATGFRLSNASYGWRFRSTETGRTISPVMIFSKVTNEDNRIILNNLISDVDLKSLVGSQRVYGECIVNVPRIPDGAIQDIYFSGPKFYIEKYLSGTTDMGDVSDVEKPKVQFDMAGLEDGKLVANEGDNKIISCVAVDPGTRRPIEGLDVQWVFEYKEGTLADTIILAKNVKVAPVPSGSVLRLQEIYKTASGLRAKCVAINANRGLNRKPGQEDPIDPNVQVESPYIIFDVTSTGPGREEDKVVPKPVLLTPKDFKFLIEGLDENGNLAISEGSDKELRVKLKDSNVLGCLLDPETGEELPKDPRIKYGVELSRSDKLPAAIGVLAQGVEMDSNDGTLKIKNYRGDTLNNEADDLFLRFTVERPSLSGDGILEKFGSEPIPVKTLNAAGEVVSDNRDPAVRLPDLTPVVLGLSACGNLVYDEGDNVTLKCIVRGMSDVDDSLVFAWRVIRPGGAIVPIANNLARSVQQEGSKLRLVGMGKQDGLLYGRCLVARKSGNAARYSSHYFPIGGKCKSMSKIVSKVNEIPTISSHERKFICKAIDSETGQQIQVGNFLWEFSTSSGEPVLSSHIFSKVEIKGDTIQLSRPIPDLDLSKYLGPNDGRFIMGRCRVILSEDGDESEQPYVPPSDPFIAVTDIMGTVNILDPVDLKDEKPKVIVAGVEDDRVNRNEGDSMTLNCEAQYIFSPEKLEGLKYAWEIRRNDNKPVETSALADKVEMLPTGEIKLTSLKQSADVLRARCILINDTKPPEAVPGIDQGPLPAGESKPGKYIKFNVQRDPSNPVLFNDTKLLDIDEMDPPKFIVQVKGLDDKGAMASEEGDEVTIKGKLIDPATNEEFPDKVRFGIEASYVDGSPAPLGILADSVTVDAQTGEIKLTGFKGDKLSPQRDSLRVRVIAERIDTEPEKPVLERFASKYIPVVLLGDGSIITNGRPTVQKFSHVYPTINGLSPCGNLFLQPGFTTSVYCKATSTFRFLFPSPNPYAKRDDSNKTELEDQFVYGWELFNAKGDSIPLVGIVANSAVIEGSALRLIEAKTPSALVFGRCAVSRKAGDDTRYYSPVFQVGGECDRVPLLTTTTTKAPPKVEIPTDKPPVGGDGEEKVKEDKEKGPIFSDTVKEDDLEILFRLTGIDPDRVVRAKPGDNATITCTAYNAQTNEVIFDASAGWEFYDLELNKMSPMRIAKQVTVQGKNAINFIELRKEPRAGGRCLITLGSKATISTPFFYFHVTDDERAQPPPQLPNGETSIEVLVEGLNEKGQIAVKQIGDDAQLTCKARRLDTNELITENIRYGWEWRYLDNDPAMTSNLAVGIKTDGDSMELRGIRAPEGLGGRGVKGRCVLHVSKKIVDPEAPDGDRERKFASPYFMVVVDRVPTVMQPPIPGHEIDGISVEIEGATNAELKASQGSNAKLDCVVKNTTSGKPISAALYAIVYGWEFRDAAGDAVDSSFFANAVNIEPFGSLKLSGLSAPPSGRFPMRIRCYATLARRLPATETDAPQSKFYTSDYVGLLIARDDGTVTGPQPGQPEPDLQGKLFEITVEGLHPSGDLKSLPGEDAELTCVITDKRTDQRILSDRAIYDWSLLRPDGQKLPNGQMADEVFYAGDRLLLKHVRLLDPSLQGSMGRCEVFYNGQTYSSPFFKLDFTPKRPEEQIEGDGVLDVDIDGTNKILGVIQLTPEEKTIQCSAVDSKSQRHETDVTYDWEYFLRVEGLPDMPEVIDSERVETFKESLNGKLALKGTGNVTPPKDKVMHLRCRVTKDGKSYTSPYYSIRSSGEEIEPERPEEKPVPKYWAKISGLDDQNRASANPGDDMTLGCQAMVTETGEEATDVDYLWEIRSSDGRLTEVGQLGAGDVKFFDKEITINKVNPSHGAIKGRCVIVDRATKEHYPSQYFVFAVPPDFDPKDIETMLPIIKDVLFHRNHPPQDERIKVWVTELNEIGNLNGMVGDDASLKCNAEAQVQNAEVTGYSWEFVDEYSHPLSSSVLAKDVQFSTDGSLQMNGLRAYKDREGYHAITGRCFANVKITGDDDRVEELRFPSKFFHFVIRDIEDPYLPKMPEDPQGEFVVVTVDGLNEVGNLKAEPGDTVTLACKAKDIEANIDDVQGPMAWRFTDSLSREVPAERLAMSVERVDRQLILTHLRPTPKNIITRGKCVVFSEQRRRIYSSIPFDVIVKRKELEEREDDEVVVKVTGDIVDNAFSGSKGGDGNLVCAAKNRTSAQDFSPEDVTYSWEFEINNQWHMLDRVSGDIASNIVQSTDPNNPQVVVLQLKGLNSVTKWTRARCSVTTKDKPSGKTYHSIPFTSGKMFDPTTTDGQFAVDPDVSVRVHGLDEDYTVIAKEGNDRILKCSAIDMNTGLPIDNVEFTWDLRTVDDRPLITNKLAQQVRAVNGELQLSGLKTSSRTARARCLAVIPERDEIPESESKRKRSFHSSPVVKFQVSPLTEEVPTEPKIDISNLKIEVTGLSPSGSLTDIVGENRTLDCIVTNKYTGVPIVEDISLGWVLATGPDNQPFELNRLAESVKFEESKLILSGLRRTGQYTGGLRGQCVVYAEGGDAMEVPVVKSDVFAIHISSKPTVDFEKPEAPEDEMDKGLPDQWIPGAEPKDAVAVVIHELNRDGEFESNVGADATLTCVAHDTKTQEQLKVGVPGYKISPRFGWEVRDANTGEELSFSQLASGQITVTQTSPGVDAPDASAASRLRLEGLQSTVGKSLQGRCTVSLNGQRYQSAYFPISIGGKRVPGSVVTADDIPGYYESDNAVTVVVSGLDSDGGKIIYNGEDGVLTCTAMNFKSKIPLPDKSVFYGWKLVNAEGQELPPERVESLKVEGNTLTLTKVTYTTDESDIPEPIYGWCIAGVKQQTGLPGLRHYRSDTFIIHPNGERVGEPVILDKPEIKVSVSNVGGDEDFLIRAGEDIEMQATAIDAKTGEKVPYDKVKIGWEWTDVGGARPINLGEFAAGGEELTPEGAYNVYEVNLPQPVRGRAVVTYSVPEEGKEWRYASPYIFLSPDREGEEPPREIPFDEATDKNVIIKITGLNDKAQFVVPRGGEGSVTVEAQEAAFGTPLTKETDPALIGYGWDVVDVNGLPTHSGNLADQIKMDPSTGQLSISNLKTDGQKVLLRMTALVETTKTVKEKTVTERKRYKSDPIPLVSEGGTWPEESGIDISGKDVTISIEGLEEGRLVVNPGENAELKAVVKDYSGADVKPNGYSWTFIDRKGFLVPPSLITKGIEETPDGGLKLNVIQPSAIADGVRGRCRVAVEREGGAKGPRYYESSWFDFKSRIEDETDKHEGPEVTPVEQDYGFTLKIKSESSVLYPRREGDIVMARPHLPLELNCVAEFAEGVSPRLSDAGIPIPQLAWYYRRPELLGDVPIPAELFRVNPGKLQTLLISEVDDHTIRISSDHYDFRDDVAEFQCHAMDGDKLLMAQTVFINRVKERIRVQVFDEKFRTAVYALENTKSTLSCYVEGKLAFNFCYEIFGGRVEPLSYKWEIKQPKLGWDENIQSGEIATKVTGVNGKDLVLDGLLVSKDDPASSSYQLRCVAQYNETYFVVSRGYAVNVHRTPELKAIRLIREKPEQQELIGEPAKDIYDAGTDYLVTCKPEFFAGEAHAVWEKFNEEFEEWEVISPPLDQLFFENDSTEYEDEGQYRCRVSHNLQDYDYHMIKTRVLELSRIAGPAPSTKSQQTVTANQQLMLQCADHSASPQVEVNWSFKPSGEAPPEGKDPFSLGSYFQYGRNNIFMIPPGQLLESHSGVYTCTRTNEHGQASTEITVTVKPVVYESAYRKKIKV
ncbi:hypothetical protein ACTXT7_005980 [Hymenolepis weldensis]